MDRIDIWKKCLVEAGYSEDRIKFVSEGDTNSYKGTGFITLWFSHELRVHRGLYERHHLDNFLSRHELNGEPIRVTFNKQEFIFAGTLQKLDRLTPLLKVVAEWMKNGEALDPEEFPLALVEGDLINVLWGQINNPTEEFEKAMATYVIQKLKPFLKKIITVEKQDTYSEAIKTLLIGAETQIDQAIKNKQRDARNYFESLGTIDREIAKLEADKVVFQKRNAQLTPFLDQLKVYLKKNKLVSLFDLSGQVLSFKVTGITIKEDDLEVSMPAYRVKINLLNSHLVITLDGQSGEADSYFHPHVKRDGDVCLGNFSEIYRKVLLSGDLRQCIEIILEFLRSYNPSSSYCSLNYIYLNYPQK